MPEKQPTPLNPRAAQEILGARTEFIDDPRFGEGIKFTLPVGPTLEIFSRDGTITAARVDSPGHGGYVAGKPLSFTHGEDWVGVRGTTEEGITVFAALRKTGAATTRSSDLPSEGSDPAADQARLDFVNRKLAEMEDQRPEREAHERARREALDRLAHPPQDASPKQKKLALLVRQHQRLGALAEALAEREGIDISEAYDTVQAHIIDELCKLEGVTPDPSDDTPISELARRLATQLSGEAQEPAAQVVALPTADEHHADDEDRPASEPGAERGKLVSFNGNLGRDPKVFTVRGRPRVKLIVGEHIQAEGEEQTVWHEVWTTDKIGPKIAQLADEHTLKQGTEVAIKGYQHRHLDTDKGPGDPFVRAFLIRPTSPQKRGS